ncbi:MAG TPA: hypothetical protein VIR79_00565 [Nitrospira sp.]
MTALHLASQDQPGVSAMGEEIIAQQLADAATELVVAWFHDSSTTPGPLAGLLAKRQGNAATGPSFFDAAGRSQFVGTAERPDIVLDASDPDDDRALNSPPSGFSGSMRELGRLEMMKVYGPSEPGLLGTLEVKASTAGRKSMASAIRLQLGALNVPAIRAAVQIGQGLGVLKPGGASPVLVHWGDLRVMGNLVLNREDDVVVKSGAAPVTGEPYELMGRLEDRWIDYWIGGDVLSIAPPSSSSGPVVPMNVYRLQEPIPGTRLDRWDYDLLKRTALRHGSYYRLDRTGRLHPFGAADSDIGLLPGDILSSPMVGRSRGLIFIDTVDGQAPRPDNLGTLVLDVDYIEALLVVQGHVLLRPSGSGRSVPVLSPSPEGFDSLGTRVPATLSGINFNGVLYAAGSITLDRSARLYGAVMTADTIVAGSPGLSLEVWYGADLAKGLFKGLPVVYRASGTWQHID